MTGPAAPAIVRVPMEGVDQLLLAGVNDANLIELARISNTRVALRGDALIITGDPDHAMVTSTAGQRTLGGER